MEGLVRLALDNPVTAFIVLLLALLPLFSFLGSPAAEPESARPEPLEKRDYTLAQLRECDGSSDKPLLVCIRGDVFDVREGADFYGPGGPYAMFAGRDATRALARMSFEEADLANPRTDDLSPMERDQLDDWYGKFRYFKSYPIVGRLVAPPEPRPMTGAELAQLDGSGEPPEGRTVAPMCIGAGGKVFDVSFGGASMYGKGCPYNVFVGVDASRALAKMSLDAEVANNPDVSDLSESERTVLDQWVTKFEAKYPIVGVLA